MYYYVPILWNKALYVYEWKSLFIILIDAMKIVYIILQVFQTWYFYWTCRFHEAVSLWNVEIL